MKRVHGQKRFGATDFFDMLVKKKTVTAQKLLLGEEAEASPSIANTLRRV